MSVSNMETLPMELETDKKISNYSTFEKIIKRAVDICGALLGIIILLPMTVVIKVVNLMKGNKDSIFFSQYRIGKDGKVFKLYKFQTMVPNADEYLKKYLNENEAAKEEYKKYKKLKEDPRVTDIGKILRNTSLDEFPQFINVLKGDMSLVGPRPYLPREKDDMAEYYDYIVKCQPGITGPWQVSGRNEVDFETRLKADYEYYQNRSLSGDTSILFKTVGIVTNKRGAL